MATVTIACKTASGFLMEVEGKTQRINGWNTKTGNVIQVAHLEKVGYTEDVPKEMWDKWRTINARHNLVVNGLVHAQATTNSVKAEAKERKGTKSGMEAIDPNAKNDGVEKETN